MELKMKASGMLCGLIFSFSFWIEAGGVLCFNCVSTQIRGCGVELDLPLLARSKRSRQGLPARSNDLDEITQALQTTRMSRTPRQSRDSVAFKSTENPLSFSLNDDTYKLTTPAAITTRIVTMGQDHTSFGNNCTDRKADSTNINIHTERNIAEPRASREMEYEDVADDHGNQTEKYRSGAKSLTDKLVVDCPGSTCLLQRLPTSGGDVYVRTCDVSHVTSGQCHLVTGVLGARISVVCVCTGDLCNQNGVAAASSATRHSTHYTTTTQYHTSSILLLYYLLAHRRTSPIEIVVATLILSLAYFAVSGISHLKTP